MRRVRRGLERALLDALDAHFASQANDLVTSEVRPGCFQFAVKPKRTVGPPSHLLLRLSLLIQDRDGVALELIAVRKSSIDPVDAHVQLLGSQSL